MCTSATFLIKTLVNGSKNLEYVTSNEGNSSARVLLPTYQRGGDLDSD